MKRIISYFLVLVVMLCAFCFMDSAYARKHQPFDNLGPQHTYTDFDFYGASWKIVSDTTTWTSVFSGSGIIYAIYCVAIDTNSTSTNYIRGTDTMTVIVPDIYVPANANRTSDIRAVSFTPAKPIASDVGLKVKPGALANGTTNTVLWILYK